MGLDGKRIVIIGGTSGIGLAVAQGAIAEGAEVVVGSSQAANVETSTRQLGNRASGRAINVRDEDSVAAFFGDTGPFDHLVFTAGDWGGRGPRVMTDTDLTTAASLYAVRHWGALATIKHGLPKMSEGGSITLTNGMVAHRPRKGGALSTAMAGGIEHLTRGLAFDLAPIRSTVSAPAPSAPTSGIRSRRRTRGHAQADDRAPADRPRRRAERSRGGLPLPDERPATRPARCCWSMAAARWSEIVSVTEL